MPYLTHFNGAAVAAGTDALVVELPSGTVLDDFGASAEFDRYNVENDANGADTLAQGDFMAPLVGGTPLSGAYLGSGSLSTERITLGVPTDDDASNLGLTVRLNPVEGHFFRDETGNVHMISDDPFDTDHLGVTLTVKLPGTPAQTVNVPLSQLNETVMGMDPDGLLEPLLYGVTDGGQYILGHSAVTLDFDPDDPMILDDDRIGGIVCFARGTLIETGRGLVPVERLAEGDLAITRDNGAQPIRWIGSVRLDAAALRADPGLRPVRIRAGALGEGVPAADLVVSPQHRVLVRSKIARRMFGADEVLVAAKQLLALPGIDIAQDAAEVEYFHFLLDRHEVVFSNGAATESLYTGPEALKSVGSAARAEIFALFPELRDHHHLPPPARALAPGRMARRLALRHLQKQRPMVI